MSWGGNIKLKKLINKKDYKQGVACAILCAILWGVLPVYWKALHPIPPILIIFYRILLVGIFSFALSIKLHKWKGIVEPLKQKGVKSTFFFSGLLITTNWSIYIWAVSMDHIIQTCIGYYIEPLFVCLFGIVIFHEKLDKYKIFALVSATAAVLVMIFYYGEFPVISISLAVTFATYAAIKKRYHLNAVLSLLYETMFLIPFALAFILYMEFTGAGAFTVAHPYQVLLLAFAGVITGVPLMLFSMAANRVKLFTLGLTEYISPSLTLMLGIFLYQEPFDTIQLICFAIIWVGLVIFTIGEFRQSKEEIIQEEKSEVVS